MYRFVLGMLVLLTATAGTWSVLEKHWFTALIYYAIAVFLYNKLEKDVFRE